MKVVNNTDEIRKNLEEFRKEGKTVGFVPTMGALHEGHLALVKQSVAENDITAVSIFVNPNQFNNLDDLRSYPRTEDSDLDMLAKLDVDLVFVPDEDEIYPEPDTRVFEFGNLEKVMEGEKRPGHFNGVAQIVSKLFDIFNPDRAYFGEKDYQQVAVIKNMVIKLNYNVNVVACPTVREADGLAMSSRNMLLLHEERKNAPEIYKTLLKARNLAADLSVSELKDWVIKEINKKDCLEVEYFEVVNEVSLNPICSWNEESKKIGCIAVFAGKIRLIDNIRF